MKYCKPEGLLDAFHARELESMERFSAHSGLAAAGALHYCTENGICPPPWAVSAASELLIDLLKREKATKRGRTAGHIARYRQDFWDIERWDAVQEVRRIRANVKEDSKIIRANPSRYSETKYSEYHEKWVAWFRHGTFECASMYLSGRSARAGAEAIRASNRRVKRSMNNDSTAIRYFLFEEKFLQKIGLEGLTDRKPGTKWLPLYNLTP